MMKKLGYIPLLISLMYSQEYCSVASGAREYYNYELKKHSTVVYRGQTKDPHGRKSAHIRDGKQFTHMVVKGNAKTRQGALKAEKKSLQTYRKSHGGKNPKYNKTNHG